MNAIHEQRLWGIVLAAGEGARVRTFLRHLCGGRGIKQFCAITGRRSLLEHTLTRVAWLIPRERILIVVSPDHQEEVEQQLADWPVENIIYQPTNRDTAPGIFLPLAHASYRDPFATVAIFPSDHFILKEASFMAAVRRAVAEVHDFPREMILLGMTPDRAEEGYGWIEPGSKEAGRETRAVQRFWEKPSLSQTRELLARSALWNTFVGVARASTLWEMARHQTPDLHQTFNEIRQALGTPDAQRVTERVYTTLRAVNFSSDICEPLTSWLRVLPAPEVGWSDWGSAERIYATLQQLGRMNDAVQRAFVAATTLQKGKGILTFLGKEQIADVA
jgi:mannose-1-phosphate guanylyltransferase